MLKIEKRILNLERIYYMSEEKDKSEDFLCGCLCHSLVVNDFGKDHECCKECPGCGQKIKLEFYQEHFDNCRQFM